MFVLLFHLSGKVFTSKIMIVNASMTEITNWEAESLYQALFCQALPNSARLYLRAKHEKR